MNLDSLANSYRSNGVLLHSSFEPFFCPNCSISSFVLLCLIIVGSILQSTHIAAGSCGQNTHGAGSPSRELQEIYERGLVNNLSWIDVKSAVQLCLVMPLLLYMRMMFIVLWFIPLLYGHAV
jgi:hypothetical protein